MWKLYFVIAINVIAVIRLIVIFTSGEMNGTEKVRKASNWVVGLVLLFVSWKIINVIFPGVDIGTPSKGEIEDPKEIKQEKFDRTNSSQDSTTIHIRYTDENP